MRKELQKKADALRGMQGSGRKGREWTIPECIMIIQMVLGLRIELHMSKTQACEFVARHTARRPQSVFHVVNNWVENGELVCYKGEARGHASENYPVHTNLSEEQQKAVLIEVAHLNSEGQPATARVLQSYIKVQFGLLISTKRLCQQFRMWGGKYKKMKELTPIDRDFQERRVAQFIVRYAKALKLQAKSTHVIVYTDESYAHDNHASLCGWVFPTSEGVNVNRRDGRLIILHAMTKDGLLTEIDTNGNYIRDEERDKDLNQISTNAEYVYEIDTGTKKDGETESVATKTDAKDDKELYHGNINSALWVKWLENRLIPSFKAKYPDNKLILIMDNASYHKPMQEGYLAPGKMTRAQLVEALQKYGIHSFEGVRPYPKTIMSEGSEIVKFTDCTWRTVTGGRKDAIDVTEIHNGEKTTFRGGYPYKKELKYALKLWLEARPEMTKTITHLRLDEMESFLIYTPPLEPECQPIELLWGMVKKLLAGMYKNGRDVETAREQLMAIFYTMEHKRRKDWTHPTPARGVTASHCRGMVRSSEEFMNNWIRSHDRLLGDLNQLLYPVDFQPDQAAEEQSDPRYVPPATKWRVVNEGDWEDKVKEVVSLLMNYGFIANEEEKEGDDLRREVERLTQRTWGGEGESDEETDDEENEEEKEEGKEEKEEGEPLDEDENDEGDEEAMLSERIAISGDEVREIPVDMMSMMMGANAAVLTTESKPR